MVRTSRSTADSGLTGFAIEELITSKGRFGVAQLEQFGGDLSELVSIRNESRLKAEVGHVIGQIVAHVANGEQKANRLTVKRPQGAHQLYVQGQHCPHSKQTDRFVLQTVGSLLKKSQNISSRIKLDGETDRSKGGLRSFT
jgi:hypothetical protein